MPGKKGVSTNARTPEDLETLFEDALMLGDQDAVTELFEETAVLVVGSELPVHGRADIGGLALATWRGDHPYVADPCGVMQARDVALIVTKRGTNVARRDGDGIWRYAIVFQSIDDPYNGRRAQ